MFLVFFFLFLIVVFSWVVGFGSKCVVSWGVLSNAGLDYSVSFVLDNISLICSIMLFLCGIFSMVYCFHYLGDRGDFLFLIMFLFWMVMSILVFSNSSLITLVFWEYLGLVSFFLILFYCNGVSLRAALVTLFMSRLGDVSLFFLVGWLENGFWGFMFWEFLFSVLLVVMTKSACYPFVSWLLEAMRAPTPVSALVHSSTLVAAGVWFSVRYSNFMYADVKDVLSFVALLTVFVSGVCAMVFSDLKKLVALSTCSNISWCLLFFVFGDWYFSLFQLLVHGVCKCYLFMSVGDLMSSSGGSQESFAVYVSRNSGSLEVVIRCFLVLSLCGFPYLGSFFCKHLLFSEWFYGFDLVTLILLVLGVLVSYAYSFRLVLLFISSMVGLSMGYVSIFVVLCMVSFFGSLLGYICVSLYSESVVTGVVESFVVFLTQVFGGMLGCYLFFNPFNVAGIWLSELCGGDSLVHGISLGLNKILSIYILSLYRWEFGVLSWMLFERSGVVGVLGISLNLLILGIMYFVFIDNVFG
uniref:NADH:ubiquinone reductase (H(+)-translocating) n=1 Tax=Brachydistomum sp. PakPr2 TaxID=2714095 RepID=A0A6H0YBA6_9TREM|nr:NADH dehydrogenase subunit 5 [Brachydistomum sp. PakPr2]